MKQSNWQPAPLAHRPPGGQTNRMAWHVLEPILVREGLDRDAPQLLEPLRAAVEATDPPTRRRNLKDAAALLSNNGHATRLLRALAQSDHPAARRLALELAAR